MNASLSLEEQRREFCDRSFLAMPIAGAIAWAVVGVAGMTLPLVAASWTLYIATGSIFGLGVMVSKMTGEDLLGKTRPKNVFDNLFMATVLSAWLVFAIAIPFAMVEPTSLPLSVGILAGLMWIPFSWIIQHWVGLFHGVVRTVLLVVAYFVFPEQRFVVIPFIVVAIYLVTIAALVLRHREPRWNGLTTEPGR